MPVTDNYLNFVLEQLNCIGRINYKKMFGGVMISFQGKPFSLIANDVLYFNVDDSNKADYESAAMKP